MKPLVEFNGVFFQEGTDEKVKQIVSYAINEKPKKRFRFWFGDVETGEAWNEEYGIVGYIVKSTDPKKIPLLIYSKRSFGGGALLCDCIVKIVEIRTKKVVYQHNNFHQDTFVICDKKVFDSKGLYGYCKSTESAQRLADFMNGKRMCK